MKRNAILRSRDWLPIHVPPGIAVGDLVTLRRSVGAGGEVPGVVVPVQLASDNGRALYFPLLPEAGSRSMIQPDPHVPLLVLDFVYDSELEMHVVQVLMEGRVLHLLRSDLRPVSV